MTTKRRIVAVTGARSDYDLMYPVYQELAKSDFFDFKIIVTGPHLSENFGSTEQFVAADGFEIADRIYSLVDSNKKIGRVVSLGYQIPALAHAFNRLKPDLAIVAGDREEAIAVAMTAAYMDTPVAHFFGGDIAKDGNIDNSVRYATSKFAHLHFTTLPSHKENLLKLGEDEWRIHVVGNPALDRFLQIESFDKKELAARMGISLNEDERYVVLIQHSIITEVELQAAHIRLSLNAIQESGFRCFLNYPNSDAGNYHIIEAYNEFQSLYPNQFKAFKNLDRATYVNLLRNATILLGNSSSGLLEAPSLGLPAINIGARQRGRIHGSNVVFVDNNKEQILEAIHFVINDNSFREKLQKKINPYGDGRSSHKIIEILKSIQITDNLVHKNITY